VNCARHPQVDRLKTDSIVRGTTSKEIVQMAKDVGARKVIVASCAPPIRYFNSPGYKRFLIGDVKILQRVWD
jgi:hypothetical protein